MNELLSCLGVIFYYVFTVPIWLLYPLHIADKMNDKGYPSWLILYITLIILVVLVLLITFIPVGVISLFI